MKMSSKHYLIIFLFQLMSSVGKEQADRIFKKCDTSGDNQVSLDELRSVLQRDKASSASDSASKPSSKWSSCYHFIKKENHAFASNLCKTILFRFLLQCDNHNVQKRFALKALIINHLNNFFFLSNRNFPTFNLEIPFFPLNFSFWTQCID